VIATREDVLENYAIKKLHDKGMRGSAWLTATGHLGTARVPRIRAKAMEELGVVGWVQAGKQGAGRLAK